MEDNVQIISNDPSLGSSPKASPSSVNPQTPKTEPKEEEEPINPSLNQNSMTSIDQEYPATPSTSENPPDPPISPILKTPEELDPKENRPEVIIYAHKDYIENTKTQNHSKVLILGQQGIGKSTLINKLLGAEFEEDHEKYVLKDPFDPKYAKIGNLAQGAGTFYPRAYTIDPYLTVVDTAGYLDTSTETSIRISSHMLLDLIVRTGITKIVLVLNFETIGKLNELIYKEMKILEQIINRADVDVLLAVNKYPADRKFFSMTDQEQVDYVNKRILEEGSNVIQGLENQICNLIEGPLEKYEKLKWGERFKSTVNSMVNSKLEDLVQRFKKLLEDEKIKKALRNDPIYKDSEQKINDMDFIYHFFKYNIEKYRNFQYFDVLNTPSIAMLKCKMINLKHIENKHIVFFGNTSPILSEFQEYMDKIHFKNSLPFFKQYIFRKLYPLEVLKYFKNDLSKYLEEHPIVDNSKEKDRLKQDNTIIDKEIEGIEQEKAALVIQDKVIFKVITFEDYSRFYPEKLVEEKTNFPIIDFKEELEKDTEREELFSSTGNLFKAKYKSYGLFNWLWGTIDQNSPCKGKILLYTKSELFHSAELKHLDSLIPLKRGYKTENEAIIQKLTKISADSEEASKQKQKDLSLLEEIITEVENTRTPYDDLYKERD